MLPRHASDYRTILWMAMMPALAVVSYLHPTWSAWLTIPGCYLASCAGIFAHNHLHSPTFRNKRLNAVMSLWLSIFYGYPTFAWVPTHNLNHHKLVNGPGDATITWRHSRGNNLLVAASYFFVSSYYQSDPIKAYIRKARESNRPLFRQIITQYVVWSCTHIALLTTACVMHGVLVGTKVFFFAFALPAIYALWMIMTFNYMQHVHTDPWSETNHSRNFVSKLFNFMMFNNGFHTAHHENAGTHWSKLPEVHARLAPGIDPVLNQQSFVWWAFKSWILAPIFPSLASKQVGRAPWELSDGQHATNLASDDVDALDAGNNAEIARVA